MEQTGETQRQGGSGGGKRLSKDLTCLYALPMDPDNRVVKA